MTAFSPSVINKAANNKWRCREIQNSRIHSLCRFFTKLLRSFGTDRTLRIGRMHQEQGAENKKGEYQYTLFHTPV